MNTRDTGTAGGGDPGYFYILGGKECQAPVIECR